MTPPGSPARTSAPHRPAPGPAQATGVLLVDDHELVRLGFRALVQAQPVGTRPTLHTYEASTLVEALATYERHADAIAVVVLDLSLSDARGLDGLVAFRQKHPNAVVVVLSGTVGPALGRHALALGAAAFFPKSGDLLPMLEFVRTCVHDGLDAARARGTLMAPASVASLSGGLPSDDTPLAAGSQALTTRQLQILQWLVDGKSNREISAIANLSEGTVKNHVSMLLLSFAVRSRAQLISKLRA